MGVAEVGDFVESDGEQFCEEVLGSWICGEDVETFLKDPFKTMET